MSPTYKSWCRMKRRCFAEKSNKYQEYGAKGITVCDRWLNFENFLADMGERPEGTSLDRINGEKSYEPGNCRWSDIKTQNRNKKNVIMITFDGVTKPLIQWVEEFNLNYKRAHARHAKNYPAKYILSLEKLSTRFNPNERGK